MFKTREYDKRTYDIKKLVDSGKLTKVVIDKRDFINEIYNQIISLHMSGLYEDEIKEVLSKIIDDIEGKGVNDNLILYFVYYLLLDVYIPYIDHNYVSTYLKIRDIIDECYIKAKNKYFDKFVR